MLNVSYTQRTSEIWLHLAALFWDTMSKIKVLDGWRQRYSHDSLTHPLLHRKKSLLMTSEHNSSDSTLYIYN